MEAESSDTHVDYIRLSPTEFAVRLTYHPTGEVFWCDSYHSAYLNRIGAFAALHARLNLTGETRPVR